MLESKSLLNAFSQNNNECKFYNNDDDKDLGEVLEFVFGGKIHKHILPYSDGTIRTTSYFKNNTTKEWHGLNKKPEEEAWIVVKDINENEYEYHQYLDNNFYSFTINPDGSEDGIKADFNRIVKWRYQ